MKQGFLFGMGFCAAYFAWFYACDTTVVVLRWLLKRWQYRRTYNQQMKAIKEGNLAGGQAQAQHREYSN